MTRVLIVDEDLGDNLENKDNVFFIDVFRKTADKNRITYPANENPDGKIIKLPANYRQEDYSGVIVYGGAI